MMNDQNNAPDAGLAAFAEYFRRNYPGPDTVIMNPDWHAPRIWRAAVQAYEADPNRYRQAADLTRADRAAPEGQPVTLTYTNWRGETAERAITPKRIWFGSTDWHPEPQWLLTAFDAEKQADRDFALKDFGQAPPPAAPTDNTALVEAAQQAVNEWAEHLEDGDPVPTWVAPLAAALASREPPPASQQEAVTVTEVLQAAITHIDKGRDGMARNILYAALRTLKGGKPNG